jgi:hypothetical protein
LSAPISVISNVKNCIGIKTLLTIDKDYLKKTLKRGGYIRYDDNVTEYYNRNEILFIRDILEPIVKLNLIQELNLVSDISIKKYFFILPYFYCIEYNHLIHWDNYLIDVV